MILSTIRNNEKDRFVSPMIMVRVLSRGIAKVRSAFDLRYHPERHYMRGPGPACRRKQQMEARQEAQQSREATSVTQSRMTPRFAPKA